MNEWISVKERLPNEEDDVLILVREIEHYGRHHEKRNVYHWQFVGWHVDEKWATTYCHGFRYIDDENEKEPRCEHEVTHWMPLPEPPEEEVHTRYKEDCISRSELLEGEEEPTVWHDTTEEVATFNEWHRWVNKIENAPSIAAIEDLYDHECSGLIEE